MNAIGAGTSMFIDSSWQESLIALLVAINTVSGAPQRSAVLHPLTPVDVVVIAESLEHGSYRPEQWFGIGIAPPAGRSPWVSVAPEPHAGQTYAVVRFAAEPSGRDFISSRSGGLLYEDPFYAVLAAFNAGTGGKAVEVQASSRDEAWTRRREIVEAIRLHTYRPDRYFAECGPLLTDRPQSHWEVGSVSGEDLKRLAFDGGTTASFNGTPPRFQGLYKYVAP